MRSLTPAAAAGAYTVLMERLLQVADECDDMIAACLHWGLGAATRFALLLAALAAAAVWVVSPAL